MMKLLTIFIMLFFSKSCFPSQDHDVSIKVVEFIENTLEIIEPNPEHKETSDIINVIFKEALSGDFRGDISKDERILNCFELIYDNGNSLYEDSSEERRLKLRRSMCFATIGLLSEKDKLYTFINYAKWALIGDIENPNLELIEEQYLGLLFLDIHLKYKGGYLINEDLFVMETFFAKNKDSIQEGIMVKAKSLMEEYKKHLEK